MVASFAAQSLPSVDGCPSGPGGSLDILFGTELESIVERKDALGVEGSLEVRLDDGTVMRVHVVVGAVGVSPNTQWLGREGGPMQGGAAVALAAARRTGSDDGGGILVDRRMQTSRADVFAAGDCCDARAFEEQQGGEGHSSLQSWWFQMRLWTQARMMGMYAARCMLDDADEDIAFGINMELFTHVTSFCGMKVVLLGLYNGQTLEGFPEDDFVSYTRATDLSGVTREEGGASNCDARLYEELVDSASFVRILLYRGRVVGAVLIGESDLEETVENLILDQLDVSALGPSILDPDADLEDYFD